MTDLYRRFPKPHFDLIGGVLAIEGVPIPVIAESVGTPFYAYSAGRLRARARDLTAAVAPLGVSIHFAAKACGNKAVLALLAREGLGADIVSGGELARALAGGVPAERIVFSGVGKTGPEIAQALLAGVHQINVESFEELRLVNAIAGGMDMVAEVALRINPDVDAETHAKITTGKKDNKFGVDPDRLNALDNEVRGLPHVRVVGLACHIGSQILSGAPFLAAYSRLFDIAETLKARGYPLARLDLGGGFGIPYENEHEFGYGDLAEAIRQSVAGKGYALAVEPGRSLVADAGILVASTTFVKDTGHMQFLVLDAAMNDLVRPAMYESHHDIVPVAAPRSDARRDYDIVGPICESSDTFARRRDMPVMAGGDLVAIATAGAYGASMSSTYNGRALIPEVLVDDGRFAVIRRRVPIEDQLAWETIPDFA